MNKLLSCRYNMDTNRVEARFEDGTTLAIDCISIEDEYGNTPAQRAFWVFVRFKGIHSACSYRLTYSLALQQADAEPVRCFNATDRWSMPLSSEDVMHKIRLFSLPFQPACVPFAPCPHGIQNRFQAIPQFRQRIFHPGRHFSVDLPGQQPAFLHLP